MRAALAIEMYFGTFVIINLLETSHKPGDGKPGRLYPCTQVSKREAACLAVRGHKQII